MNLRGRRYLMHVALVGCLALGASLLIGIDVNAAFNMGVGDGAASARGRDQAVDLFGQAGVFRTLTNVLLFLVGAISVIMLIIGGLRYVVSGGDSTAVQNAKNTILYAIVGIIVAILAYAVVSFVITSFSGGGGELAPTNV